ncbi:hypothetical protein [Helicobacter fennelliae]|uniref:Uncharacterized protein n=1 Tax=Helicobacter fennelliae MRY12-0050 TaxID=1325130 RepID=T1CM68_9HELI|nr:hypothetical protein [Helicobacter fennelliae]GAD17809.1 hypothetical protein HFN_0624 [Helicobacter fennelliae MRY12-0050]STP07700.1 Uncharacterised protein [Helicobacter fennelliae]
MKKVYNSKKYCYYCNKIRAKYQEKRQRKRTNRVRSNNKQDNSFGYKSLELNQKDIHKIIKDTIALSKNPKGFKISFRKLKRFDLGLCLLFTSLLEYFSESKDISFRFREDLMPKDKNIKNMFIQTGIFQILCNKPTQNQAGKLCILKISLDNQKKLKQALLRISKEIVHFSLNQIRADNKKARDYLMKIFLELMVNIQQHADTNKTIYLAGEVQREVIKFALLDKGIGFAAAIKKRSSVKDSIKDSFDEGAIRKNYVKIIFESNNERHRNYDGENIKRGNGTKRLEESIKKCKGAKMQIVSKKDFYELNFNKDELKYCSNSDRIKEHKAIGTLISFELPIREFLKGFQDDNI